MSRPADRTDDRARLVLLGASNATRFLPTLFGMARGAAGRPLDVAAAIGHGRSFGAPSSFLARRLPGIDASGLWPALATARPCAASRGVVMDVGNDILYGFDVAWIVARVTAVLARLRDHVDDLVVAGLPVHRLRGVGPLRYGLVRTLVFPGCRVPRAVALERAAAVDAALRALAVAHGARFVPLCESWYGIDPVHVRRRDARTLCAALLDVPVPPRRTRLDLRTLSCSATLRTARAEVRDVFGRERRTPQPCRTFDDGTTLSLF